MVCAGYKKIKTMLNAKQKENLHKPYIPLRIAKEVFASFAAGPVRNTVGEVASEQNRLPVDHIFMHFILF